MKTKQYITMSIKLSMLMLLLCCVCYPALITGIAQATPGHGRGERVLVDGKPVGYDRVGQRFASDRYFWSRPSAVEYNAAGSGGSNQGPSNPAHLELVAARMDSFLAHHPGVLREQVPADMVTASGSGLDPHISPAAARIQVAQVAAVRQLPVDSVAALVERHVEAPLWGCFGPAKVHVLRLNLALDKMDADEMSHNPNNFAQ